jgi:hypothetical protein
MLKVMHRTAIVFSLSLILFFSASGTFAQPNLQIYTPRAGASERTAIMDAARLAQKAAVRFQVDYLAVFRNGNVSIAVADLRDAAGEMPYGGLLFFRATKGYWRALYALRLDGSESCSETVKISKEMIAIAAALRAPTDIFPEGFWHLYKAAEEDFAKDGDQSDCSTTARY